MRHITYTIFSVLLMAAGCKPVSYFSTPNDVFKTAGTVYLLNGAEVKGKITIEFETGYNAGKFIRVGNGDREERISIDSIRYYKIDKDCYYPKKIDLDLSGTQKLLFVKRLTKENSRIHLYELYQQSKQTSDGQELFFYFISLPTQARLDAWNIGGKNFVPNFDEKMSRIVADCSTLSGKIKQKTKGYFLAPFTLSNSKKVDVLTRIINEYNDCH
jgi:hypothetical protein